MPKYLQISVSLDDAPYPIERTLLIQLEGKVCYSLPTPELSFYMRKAFALGE